jgi:hypothetical protein
MASGWLRVLVVEEWLSPFVSATGTMSLHVIAPPEAVGRLPDAMKERASAPGGCWKLHASVSTRLGGPYDGSL